MGKTIKEVNKNNHKVTKNLKLEHVKRGKIIKHAPPSQYSYKDTVKIFKLKSSSPFMSSVKQIEKKLSQVRKSIVISNGRNRGNNIIKDQFITVIGLQKVIPKLLQISTYFQERNHRIDIKTTTVKTVDEFQVKNNNGINNNDELLLNEDENEGDKTVLRDRSIAGLEAKIFIKQ